MRTQTTAIETIPISIKKVTLWRREIDGNPEALQAALQPLADAGIRLQILMRYRHFRNEHLAVVEVGAHDAEDQDRAASVMQAAGLTVSTVPAVLIEGDEIIGVEYAITKMIAEQNLNLLFCVSHAMNGQWGALMGFTSDDDAEKAVTSLLQMKIHIPTKERMAS
ncbi:MAG: hypothetical protein AB7G75_10185 [Candidatus Binatia bacterium]